MRYLASILIGLLLVGPAAAQVPSTLTIQGILQEANGDILATVPTSLTFRLYDDENDALIDAVWLEDHNTPASFVFDKGVFTAVLGGTTALPIAEFENELWLGIQVNGGTEQSPRIALTASAYSLIAKSVETVNSLDTPDQSQTNVVDVLNSGAVIINGPQLQLPRSGSKPTCDNAAQGTIVFDTSDSRTYVCDGTTWRKIAADLDEDGFTHDIDQNDNSPASNSTGTAADLLSGTTLYSYDGNTVDVIGGTMPNQSGWAGNPSSSDVPVPAGYHDGTSKINGDAGYTAANIRNGSSMWGLVGTYPSAGNLLAGEDGTPNAGAAQVLTGYEFWDSDGSNPAGTMPNQGAWIRDPSTVDQAVPAGYHDGNGKVNGDADFTAANIREGVDLWGVVGTHPDGVQITDNPGIPDAAAGQVLSGYEAWNHTGGNVQGGIVNQGGGSTQNLSFGQSHTFLAGYWSSNNIATAPTPSGSATPGQVLANQTYYTSASQSTGTMVDRGAWIGGPQSGNVSIPAGFHNGSGYIQGDGNLTAGNIRSGVSIFNVTGSFSGGADPADHNKIMFNYTVGNVAGSVGENLGNNYPCCDPESGLHVRYRVDPAVTNGTNTEKPCMGADNANLACQDLFGSGSFALTFAGHNSNSSSCLSSNNGAWNQFPNGGGGITNLICYQP